MESVVATRPSDRLFQFGPNDDVAAALRQWFDMYADYRMAVTLLLAQLHATAMYAEFRLSTTLMAAESFQDAKFGGRFPRPTVTRAIGRSSTPSPAPPTYKPSRSSNSVAARRDRSDD